MTRPRLWHLRISHYSEKARWALEYKGVSHTRRVPFPPSHIPISLLLTRGRSYTFPVLELDGRAIGDSTEIIAALEERHPDPPLYPADPDERARALALEDWFDEEVAPYTRRLVFYEVSQEPDKLARFAVEEAPPWMSGNPDALASFVRRFLALRYDSGEAAAAEDARERVLAGLDRLEQELGSSGYLVGDRFTVADLSAASLLYPLVMPPEGPAIPEELIPEAYQRFREPLKERPGYSWVAEMFRRHRVGSPAAQPADVAVPA